MTARRAPLEAIAGARVVHEPGLSEDEIDALGMPGRVPGEIRDLLRATRGFAIDDVEITLTGACGLDQVFPYAVVLANDGAGNEWVCDVRSTGAWDRVYFASHDPPEISVAAPDLATFLADAIGGGLEPPTFRETPALVDPGSSPDPIVRELAERAGEELDLFDLRDAPVGAGFDWARAGPTNRIVRAHDAAIWAVERQRPGFFARFFARLFGAR